MRNLLVAAAAVLATFTSPGRAADYSGVTVRPILTSTVASNGQKLGYLRTDSPEVTALTVEIPPGGETGWHLHAVPVYAYMLAGSITVEMQDGASYVFREGDAIFEVRDTPHNGRNTGKIPAKLVVFYTGARGTPNVTRVPAPQPAPAAPR